MPNKNLAATSINRSPECQNPNNGRKRTNDSSSSAKTLELKLNQQSLSNQHSDPHNIQSKELKKHNGSNSTGLQK